MSSDEPTKAEVTPRGDTGAAGTSGGVEGGPPGGGMARQGLWKIAKIVALLAVCYAVLSLFIGTLLRVVVVALFLGFFVFLGVGMLRRRFERLEALMTGVITAAIGVAIWAVGYAPPTVCTLPPGGGHRVMFDGPGWSADGRENHMSFDAEGGDISISISYKAAPRLSVTEARVASVYRFGAHPRAERPDPGLGDTVLIPLDVMVSAADSAEHAHAAGQIDVVRLPIFSPGEDGPVPWGLFDGDLALEGGLQVRAVAFELDRPILGGGDNQRRALGRFNPVSREEAIFDLQPPSKQAKQFAAYKEECLPAWLAGND
ncbi:MAG: hypothetical protein AAF577_12525 [Pseudomonadota bacterium]